jgi:hypothetical protein
MRTDFDEINDTLNRVNKYIEENYKNLIIEDIIVFSQTWPDTSCGFGGMAGQSFTNAFTTVIVSSEGYIVFIRGRYAYTVKNPTDKFINDLLCHSIRGACDKNRSLYEKTK